MKVGIIGCGNIAAALARRWAEVGRDVMVSSRTPAKARATAAAISPAIRSGTFAEAAQHGDVVVLAVQWEALFEALDGAGPLDGKILVDPNNMIDRGEWDLQVGFTDSCAEMIARHVPGASVVKAFNTISAEVLNRPSPVVDGQPVTLFLAGDDADAKRIVGGLGEEIGFLPVDCGPLTTARLLEPTAALLVKFIVPFGYGQATAITIAAERPPISSATVPL